MVGEAMMTYRTRAERWRRQEEASLKVQELSPDASDEEIIKATADYLIAQGPYHGGKWHLSILDAKGPVEHDWRHKNVWGITTKDAARARAWISECMRLGYGVFCASTKHAGSAGGRGSIEQIRAGMRGFGRSRL